MAITIKLNKTSLNLITLISLLFVGYSVGYDEFKERKRDSENSLSPCYHFGSGGWIRTNDFRVMRLILYLIISIS